MTVRCLGAATPIAIFMILFSAVSADSTCEQSACIISSSDASLSQISVPELSEAQASSLLQKSMTNTLPPALAKELGVGEYAAEVSPVAHTSPSSPISPVSLVSPARQGISARQGSLWLSPCPRDPVEHITNRSEDGRLSQGQQHIVDQAAARVRLAEPKERLKIGCAFKTSSSNRQQLLDAVQTWAKKCDAIYTFSDQTWQVPGPWKVKAIQLSGKDSYGNLWQKTQAMMKILHPIWQEEGFDFMVMSDTDAFFVMENLQEFLTSSIIKQRQAAGKPILLGDLYTHNNSAFVSGGGYVIDQKVVEAVASCPQHIKDQVTSADDVQISACLKEGDLHYDVLLDGPACDADGIDRFEHYSVLTQPKPSINMILFHHVVGEQRYRFYQGLYKNHTQRLCEVDDDLIEVEHYAGEPLEEDVALYSKTGGLRLGVQPVQCGNQTR